MNEDRLKNRYGNKGVIDAIIPKQNIVSDLKVEVLDQRLLFLNNQENRDNKEE